MRLLVTRPEPDAGREAETLIALGHEPVRSPLLEIEFLSDVPLPLEVELVAVDHSEDRARRLAEASPFYSGSGLIGTPEQVAKVKGSYTGRFLGPILKRKPGRRAA